jgi:hypothetical protein
MYGLINGSRHGLNVRTGPSATVDDRGITVIGRPTLRARRVPFNASGDMIFYILRYSGPQTVVSGPDLSTERQIIAFSFMRRTSAIRPSILSLS